MNRWLWCVVVLLASMASAEKVDCKAFAKEQAANCERICADLAKRQKKRGMAPKCQKTCATQSTMAQKSCEQQR